MSDLSDAPETAKMAETDGASAPGWFDAENHRIAEGGIFERATGVLLGEDGAPFSAAVRLMRAAAAEAAAADAAAAEAEAAKPARKPRGTGTVLADHINTSGAAAGAQE